MSRETPGPAARGEDRTGALRIALTLGVTGLLCGIVIVVAYEATRETIARNNARALRTALSEVLPDAKSFRELSYGNGALGTAAAGADPASVLYAGHDDTGHLVGYAIAGQGPGYQDTIRLLYGYRPDEQLVVGMHVLESRETPGLGDRIYKDREFVQSFRSLKAAPPIVTVKKGTRTAPNEVDAITGATISSVAVVRILNASIAVWAPRLEGARAITPGDDASMPGLDGGRAQR